DACAGLPLKKSPPARAHDHLHRRKRSKPATASLPDLVASRRHTRSAVQFQLEVVVGRGRDHLLQLLFPALSRHGEEPAGDRFPRSSAAAHLRTAADRVGPARRSSERHRTRLHLRTGWSPVGGIPSRLTLRRWTRWSISGATGGSTSGPTC